MVIRNPAVGQGGIKELWEFKILKSDSDFCGNPVYCINMYVFFPTLLLSCKFSALHVDKSTHNKCCSNIFWKEKHWSLSVQTAPTAPIGTIWMGPTMSSQYRRSFMVLWMAFAACLMNLLAFAHFLRCMGTLTFFCHFFKGKHLSRLPVCFLSKMESALISKRIGSPRSKFF